jgi:hypothetical protein
MITVHQHSGNQQHITILCYTEEDAWEVVNRLEHKDIAWSIQIKE